MGGKVGASMGQYSTVTTKSWRLTGYCYKLYLLIHEEGFYYSSSQRIDCQLWNQHQVFFAEVGVICNIICLALHSHTAELLTATVHSCLSLLDSSLPSSTLEILLFNVRLLLVFWGVTHAHVGWPVLSSPKGGCLEHTTKVVPGTGVSSTSELITLLWMTQDCFEGIQT